MPYFAQIDEADTVVNVQSIEQNVIDTGGFGDPASFIQTSYNTRGGIHYIPNTQTPSEDQSKALRKNYAGIGFKYDRVRDAFIPPQDYPSWTLNEFSCLWEAPTPYPDDGKPYRWDEPTLAWIEIVIDGGSA
jgi:hypothetical protein